MKKRVSSTTKGKRADIGPFKIMRMIANEHVDTVGPFVFLDHALPTMPLAKAFEKGASAHPHRGIATLTYMLSGEAVHLDSKGNYAKVRTGGAQWMKAGNGIIHDESVNADPDTGNPLIHVLQFWINLPAKNKAEDASYLPLQEKDIPKKMLKENTGWIKVIAGQYEDLVSAIPSYSKQFLYHIHLEKESQISFPTTPNAEYAAFLPLTGATINDVEYQTGEFIMFDMSDGKINISNPSQEAIDVFIFGGEPYREPIVAQGPFVMNTQKEISQAYNDFFSEKYGKIDYSILER